MEIDVIHHSEWAETKFTLHLISQILGKIKLETAPQEPQWAHVALTITPDGLSTGLLFAHSHVFQIDVDIRNSQIVVNVDGSIQSIELKTSKSMKQYYEAIFKSLKSRDIPVTINPKPQEMAYSVPLDEDDAPREFNQSNALRGLKLFQLALLEQAKFVAPMRCRKMKPALFWGTFDVSMLILPGIMEPYPEDKTIGNAAFDEHMIEYGFWLGDELTDTPAFFAMPYPFIFKDLNDLSVKPPEAYYEKSKSQYFLTLYTVAEKDDPREEIRQFFRTTFELLRKELQWQNCDDYFAPLEMKHQKYGN